MTGGKPSPQIKWFRKNVELRTGNYKIPIIKLKHNYNIYKEEKKISIHKHWFQYKYLLNELTLR